MRRVNCKRSLIYTDLKELVVNLEKHVAESGERMQTQMNTVMKVLRRLPQYDINLEGHEIDKQGTLRLQFNTSDVEVYKDSSIKVRVDKSIKD